MDVHMEYDENDVDVLKETLKNAMEGDKPQAYHLVAFLELAVETCYEVTGDAHEALAMFLSAVAGAPMHVANISGEVQEVH